MEVAAQLAVAFFGGLCACGHVNTHHKRGMTLAELLGLAQGQCQQCNCVAFEPDQKRGDHAQRQEARTGNETAAPQQERAQAE